ncbi:MAG TPA: adenylate/guanylate cyclase domain-containing protein [Pseudolabrys sp.]|nr:adenylate/guanylate cyclase domain-containing protein [Pseudolabrys sp.]
MLPVSGTFEEDTGLWWLFTMRGAIQPPAQAVVVAIDGTTGKDLDLPKLPRDWPRLIHAQLIENLVARGADVIVFDMDFGRVKGAYEDAVFANAISKANRVVLFEPLVGKKESVESNEGKTVTWTEQKLSPSPQLAATARALGPFPLPKLGRTAFEFWAFKPSVGDAPTTPAIALQLYAMRYYDRWLAALEQARVLGIKQLPANPRDVRRAPDTRSLMNMLRNALGGDPATRERLQQTIDRIGGLQDEERRVLKALSALYTGPDSRNINFYGPPGTIERIPYQAVIKPELQLATPHQVDLKGKVVFVGYSDLADPEQPDRFYTVFTGEDGVDLSGVEIMATAFANLLTDRSLRPSSPAATIGIVLAFGFTIGAALYLLPAMIGVAFGLAASAMYVAGAQWSFNSADIWLPLVTPLLVQLPIAILIGLITQYLVGRRLERRMSRAISYYLPANIVKDLTEKHLDPSQANKVVYGACLATDMSGFTAIAEKKSPTELAKFMNAYFDEVADALKRHSVDITNFHADTIMCAWIGTDQNSPARKKAVLAALDVMQAIERFGRRDDSFKLNARIGLQDGNFYVGHTGGGGHLNYSILGDPANTASRLESLNKELGTHILAAQSVVADLTSGFLTRPLGSFRLVGKSDAIPVSEIVAQRLGATDSQIDLCNRFSHALDVLQARQWQEAAALFNAILEEYEDDGPSRLYAARCRQLADDAAPEADPTVIHLDRK